MPDNNGFILDTPLPLTARRVFGSPEMNQAVNQNAESKPAFFWQWRSRSYYTERVVDPVVMDSETLDDRQGYFVQQDKIVRIGFKPRPARVLAADLIERVIPGPPEAPAQAGTEAPPNEVDRSADGLGAPLKCGVKDAAYPRCLQLPTPLRSSSLRWRTPTGVPPRSSVR
jgi:hypothetical protein